MEEIKEKIAEVAETVLKKAAQPGGVQEKTKVLTCSIPESLHAEFKTIAKLYKTTIAALNTLLIEEIVAKFNDKLDGLAAQTAPVPGIPCNEIVLPGKPQECVLKAPEEEEPTVEAEEIQEVFEEQQEETPAKPEVNRFPSFNDWSSLLKVPKLDD
jgi:hypothetical protein